MTANMTNKVPDILEPFRISDEDRAKAYELATPEVRSVIKKNIARLHTYFAAMPEKELVEQRFDTFVARKETMPSVAALIFLPEEYAYPQCFTACVLPAVMAGVQLVLPFFVKYSPSPSEINGSENPEFVHIPDYCLSSPQSGQALMAALDLLGIVNAFRVTPEEVNVFLPKICDELGQANIISLGENGVREELALFSLRKSQPFRAPSFTRHVSAHAEQCSRLLLDEAHKDIWLWPELNPFWYRQTRIKFSAHSH